MLETNEPPCTGTPHTSEEGNDDINVNVLNQEGGSEKKCVSSKTTRRSRNNGPCPASKKLPAHCDNSPSPEVFVKVEPTSEGEYGDDGVREAIDNDGDSVPVKQLYEDDDEYEEAKARPRRASQRAAAVNIVQRKQYREIETDDDDDDFENPCGFAEDDYLPPKEEEKPRPTGRKRGRPPGSKNSNKSTDKRRQESSDEQKKAERVTGRCSRGAKKRGKDASIKDRIRKQLKRAQMAPKEKEENLKKQRERKQLRRLQMTAEEREEQRRKERERKALKRKIQTPLQRREESQRETIRRIVQHSNMTPEQMAEYKQKRYLQYLAQKARKSEKELEMKHTLHTEKQKQKRQSLKGEERQKFLEQLKDSYRKRIERLKKDPLKWMEAQNKWKEYRIKRKERNKGKSPGQVVRRRKKKEGEDGDCGDKPRKKTCPGIKLAPPVETEDEKQLRLQENKRLRIQRCNIRRRLAYQKLLDSGMTMEEIRKTKESTEARERRLITNRINFAKRSMRKRLSQRGAPPEEIEARIQEFVATYEPHRDFKPYVPRPANHRPISPEDLALINEGKIPENTENSQSDTQINQPCQTSSKLIQPVFPAFPTQSSTKGESTIKMGKMKPIFTAQPTSWPLLEFPTTYSLSASAILGQPRPPTLPPPAPPPSIEPTSPSSIAINMCMSNFASPIPSPSPSSSSTISAADASYPSTSLHQQHQYLHNFSQDAHYSHCQSSSQNYVLPSYSQQPIQPDHNQHQQNPHQAQNPSGSGPFSLFDDINSFQMKATSHSIYHQNDYSSSTCYDEPVAASPSEINNDIGSSSSCDMEMNNTFMSPPPPPIKRGRGRPRGSKTGSGQGRAKAISNNEASNPDADTDNGSACCRGGRRPGAGRPKKGEIREPRQRPKTHSKESKRIPGMPRGVYEGKDPKVKRDQVCEVCGNAYSERYIGDHRTMFHNPNFDYVAGKCLLCGEGFPSGQKFYKHFIKVHKPGKDADGKERNFVCVSCGELFVSQEGLQRHEYYQHGDGTKKENFVSCPHCQKEFKQRITLNNHIRVVHNSLGLDLYGCLRCDQKFGLTKDLKDHVRESHPESFFQCQDCKMLKYTKASLLMHQNYCAKRPTEIKRAERKKEEKYVGIERFPVNCEICSKQIALYSITRHYKDTHGVVDEVFTCMKCEKTFKRREWWVAHMETIHSIPPEDIKEEIGKYNVSDRSKVVITNFGQKRKYSNKGKVGKGGMGMEGEEEVVVGLGVVEGEDRGGNLWSVAVRMKKIWEQKKKSNIND